MSVSTANRAQLLAELKGIVFRGLTAGLGTGITGPQISSAAASASTAAAAIIASVPFGVPQNLARSAGQAATIFAALQSGNIGISGPQIASTATTAAACLAAVVSAATPAGVHRSVTLLQIDAAVQAFAGLALGLGSISGGQISSIAALAATSAASIWAA